MLPPSHFILSLTSFLFSYHLLYFYIVSKIWNKKKPLCLYIYLCITFILFCCFSSFMRFWSFYSFLSSFIVIFEPIIYLLLWWITASSYSIDHRIFFSQFSTVLIDLFFFKEINDCIWFILFEWYGPDLVSFFLSLVSVLQATEQAQLSCKAPRSVASGLFFSFFLKVKLPTSTGAEHCRIVVLSYCVLLRLGGRRASWSEILVMAVY